MLQPRDVAIAALGVALLVPLSSQAAEQVGEAVVIKTEVTGSTGPLVVNDPVHRDEPIHTSQSGLGQFTFRDGTKLAVGWGSSVVIDKFVFDDSDTVKKLTVKAAKGTFRWISGNSASSAYQIVTPAGTIGVRGTAFDFYVGANGTTAIVLLNGAAQFCGASGCQQLTRRCDVVVATRNGKISDTRRVNSDVLKTLGNQRALPFLTGNQQLSGRLGFVGAGGCGLSTETRDRPNGTSPRSAPTTSPDPAPRNTPSTPATVNTPTVQSTPAPQSTPATQNTPAPQSTPTTTSDPPAKTTPDTPDPPPTKTDPPPDKSCGRDNEGDKHHHGHYGKGEHGRGDQGRGHHGWGDHHQSDSDTGDQGDSHSGDVGGHHR